MTSCGSRRQSSRGKRWVDAYCKLLLRRLCCDDSSAPPSPCELVLKSAPTPGSAADLTADYDVPSVPTVMKHVAEDIVRGQPPVHRSSSSRAASCPDTDTTSDTSPSTTRLATSVDETSKNRVFVYGTLKSGQPNHYHFDSWKESGKCRFVGKARSAVPFPLIVATRWNLPFLLYTPGKGQVIDGEVYDVDDGLLAWMDWFEGHPAVYQRDRITVNLVGLSSTSPSSTTIDTLPTTSGLRQDNPAVPSATNAGSEANGVTGQQDRLPENQSTTCWAYFLKNYTPVLLCKESYVSFDAFGTSGKRYCPDDNLRGPKDIEDGLNNETSDNNNRAAVNTDSSDSDSYCRCYKEISGIQDVADDLAREVDDLSKQ